MLVGDVDPNDTPEQSLAATIILTDGRNQADRPQNLGTFGFFRQLAFASRLFEHFSSGSACAVFRNLDSTSPSNEVPWLQNVESGAPIDVTKVRSHPPENEVEKPPKMKVGKPKDNARAEPNSNANDTLQ